MTNILRNGAAWLATKLATNAGTEITYLRRGHASFTLTATPMNKDDEVADAEGFATVVRYRELIVTTTSLNGYTPREGDRWSESVGTFEIGSAGPRACTEPLDEEGVMTIIRGKKVS